MKLICNIALIFLIFFSITPLISDDTIFDSEAIVIPKSGLVLRKAPGTNSEKILTIPYNSKVKIFRPYDGGIGKFEVINNISSNWYKIKYNDNTGWVFGGFLNEINPKFKELIPLLETEGELEVLKKIGNFPIEFTKPNGETFCSCSYSINSDSFYCDCGRGFCSSNLISIQQSKNKIILVLEFNDCIKIEKSDDGVGPCLQESIEQYECVIHRQMLLELLNGRMIRYYVKGKLLRKTISR